MLTSVPALSCASASSNGTRNPSASPPLAAAEPMTNVRRESLAALPRMILFTAEDRKSTRLNSSHSQISYAVFCLKKNITQLRPELETIQHTLCRLLADRSHHVVRLAFAVAFLLVTRRIPID